MPRTLIGPEVTETSKTRHFLKGAYSLVQGDTQI